MTSDYMDGNVLAGPMRDVFAIDITESVAVCAGCGRSGPMAEAHVYGGGPGLVARCPGCDNVLLRYAETPYGRWLDMRGLGVLRLAPATS
ncbi:MAG TPA: DUF6510 family protein [Jatrophihabitans sp.]|nr:DUF6510 family protein [Jatrophihabitans sp.]